MDSIKENKMGTERVLPLLISMSLPSMFSMLIQALYNVVDSIFVARYNLTALSAVSLVFPVQMFVMALGVGTAIGVNSLVSRRLGEQRKDDASNAAMHGIVLAALSWVFVCILAAFFTTPFYRLFAENDNLFTMACDYSNIVVYFSLGIMLHVAIEKILQATGNMIAPMLLQLLGAVINLILDPIFIFGWGPVPSLGIRGAAIATVAGQIIACIVSLFIAFFKKHEVTISFRGFKLRWQTIYDIYVVGLPSIVMQSIGSVLISCLNGILTAFGELAVSVLGVYYKLQSFVFMPVFGMTHGAMPIMGYSYGARYKARLLECLKLSSIIAFIIMACGTVIFWLIPDLLISLFNDDANLVKMGIPALRTISLCFPVAAVCIMFSTLFQGVGKGIYSLIISLMRQLIVLLPAAYLLAKISLNAFWWSFPIAESVSLAATIFLFATLYKNNIRYLEK